MKYPINEDLSGVRPLRQPVDGTYSLHKGALHLPAAGQGFKGVILEASVGFTGGRLEASMGFKGGRLEASMGSRKQIKERMRV